MTNKKQFTGRLGEDAAADYLGSSGYDILFRNKKWKWGEIDIIARAPDKTLVFVEVKTLEDNVSDLKPEDNLTAAKLKKLQRTAGLFAGFHPELVDQKKGWQIDLVAICLTGREPVIRHYENI